MNSPLKDIEYCQNAAVSTLHLYSLPQSIQDAKKEAFKWDQGFFTGKTEQKKASISVGTGKCNRIASKTISVKAVCLKTFFSIDGKFSAQKPNLVNW